MRGRVVICRQVPWIAGDHNIESPSSARVDIILAAALVEELVIVSLAYEEDDDQIMGSCHTPRCRVVALRARRCVHEPT